MFNYPDGATPLNQDEINDLIPAHITTQEELNSWEEKNILLAQKWGFKQKDIISEGFITALHTRMFDQTWKWAGRFRKSEKNIGVSWYSISTEIRKLCQDVKYQLEHKTFSDDELAIRLHHRLVWIHPFVNGNGRHARLMADILITQLGHSRFSWGMGQDLYNSTPVRREYIDALRAADAGDYSKLIAFARS